MTNGDKLRSMTDEELTEWIDKHFNQSRVDWEGLGCYTCCTYGTHHADKSNIGTEYEHLYACKNCEFENGVLGWLKSNAD